MTTLITINYLIVFLLAIVMRSSSSHWSYNHQDSWPGYCQNGTQQSPINLAYETAEETSYTPFVFKNYNKEFSAVMNNNGHTVTLTIHATSRDDAPRISGGGLNGLYILDHFHFHWQSEHTIDDYRYPLEMHLVHYSAKYSSFQDALGHDQAVIVLGVLFDLSPDDDVVFEPFLEVMAAVENNLNRPQQLPNKMTADSFLPRDIAGFYRYEGSLTTPDCNEGVVWTVFTNTIPISKIQVKKFENVWTEENKPLLFNYRELQKLNRRIVHIKVSPINHNGANNLHTMSSCVLISLYFMLKYISLF